MNLFLPSPYWFIVLPPPPLLSTSYINLHVSRVAHWPLPRLLITCVCSGDPQRLPTTTINTSFFVLDRSFEPLLRFALRDESIASISFSRAIANVAIFINCNYFSYLQLLLLQLFILFTKSHKITMNLSLTSSYCVGGGTVAATCSPLILIWLAFQDNVLWLAK